MSDNHTLHHKALLAWRRELERQSRKALEDKATPLHEGLRRKLVEMFGTEYAVEVEVRDDDPYDLVLSAEVDGLRFIGFRSPDGSINVVLLKKCSRCEHEMPSNPLTNLSDLGRELTQFGMTGSVGEHRCLDKDATIHSD